MSRVNQETNLENSFSGESLDNGFIGMSIEKIYKESRKVGRQAYFGEEVENKNFNCFKYHKPK